MIWKSMRWNIKILFSQKELLWCPLAGLFYLLTSYIQLFLAHEEISSQEVLLITYGGMSIGDFALLPLAKMGVYLALFVRVLANTTQQKDKALPYCVSRCASYQVWIIGELTAFLLLACLWALQLLCCERLLLVFFHVTFLTDAQALVSLNILFVNVTAFFSIAVLFTALSNVVDRVLNVSICVLCGIASLVLFPLCTIIPYGFCFALRNWTLGGEACIGPQRLYGIFGVYFFLLLSFVFWKRRNGLKRRLYYDR